MLPVYFAHILSCDNLDLSSLTTPQMKFLPGKCEWSCDFKNVILSIFGHVVTLAVIFGPQISKMINSPPVGLFD